MKNVKQPNQFLLIIFLLLSTTISLIGQDYYKIIHDFEGQNESALSMLEEAAKGVTPSVEIPANSDSFKIKAFYSYPALAYTIDHQDFGDIRAKQIAQDSFNNYSHYLGIIRYARYGESLGGPETTPEYDIRLKLPNVPKYNDLPSIFKASFENYLENIINEELDKGGRSEVAEIKMMSEFIRYLEDPVDFQESMLNAGFEEIVMIPEEDLSITQAYDSQVTSLIRVVDKNGYLNEMSGETFATALGNADLGETYGMNFLVYISGVSDESNFDVLNSEFNAFEEKVKIWIHIGYDVTLIDPPSVKGTSSNSRNSEEQSIYIKSSNNMAGVDSKLVLDGEYAANVAKWSNEDIDDNDVGGCSLTWQPGKDCLMKNTTAMAILGITGASGAGLLDGLLGNIKMIYEGGRGFVKWFNDSDITVESLANSAYTGYMKMGKFFHDVLFKESYRNELKEKAANAAKYLEEMVDDVVDIYNAVKETVNSITMDYLVSFANKMICVFDDWLGSEFDGDLTIAVAYYVGVLAFEILATVLAAPISGVVKGSKVFKTISSLFKGAKGSVDNIAAKIGDWLHGAGTHAATAGKFVKCKILRQGCFVKDTPVLMAGNANQFSLRNSTKAMAVAAAMPIVAVPIPIQEVQLLDYAVAHETVNSTYGITASTDEDNYLGLMDKDPHTSDQQRERDGYEINDTDWNEVVFEEVHGSSTAKLALHNDWINQKGYLVDGVVNLALPEQGISGLFRITSIKHIIPRKKPVEDCEEDDYVYKPVTALFTHVSSDVYNISFDNGEELGVTYQHPIYSTTAGDWRLVGELEVGEEVLTKSGNSKVVSSIKKEGSETVYNLEVKELHNFLVGQSGIVVHNNCFNTVKKRLESLGVRNRHLLKKAPDNKKLITGSNSDKVKEKFPNARKKDGKLEVCYDDLGFPDFSDFIPDFNGDALSFEIDMKGNSGDMGKARSQLNTLLGTSFSNNGDISIPGYEGVNWTFHHHQDGKTMQLVPFVVNDDAKHIGGSSIAKKGGKHNFPGPEKTHLYKKGCN